MTFVKLGVAYLGEMELLISQRKCDVVLEA